MRNSIREAVGRVWNQLFDPWWSFYYTYGSCVPPLRHYLDGFSHLDDVDYDELREMYKTDYDPVCFPLPFKINCLGCMGCGSVKEPPLTPDKGKGPYKILFHPNFVEKLEGMIGKQETFDMIWDIQRRQDARERLSDDLKDKVLDAELDPDYNDQSNQKETQK